MNRENKKIIIVLTHSDNCIHDIKMTTKAILRKIMLRTIAESNTK